MKPILLIDFGSTYTKLTAVDVEEERILGTAQSFTTIFTDINDGLTNALALLEKKTGRLDFAETYACSSAAGGLRMVTSGLVPELTSEAAKLASLGAGAKVAAVYSFELLEEDLEEVGENSRITSEQVEAVVESIDVENQIVTVLIDMFGRQTPNELRFDEVEPLK